jgi:hypothetical protein
VGEGKASLSFLQSICPKLLNRLVVRWQGQYDTLTWVPLARCWRLEFGGSRQQAKGQRLGTHNSHTRPYHVNTEYPMVGTVFKDLGGTLLSHDPANPRPAAALPAIGTPWANLRSFSSRPLPNPLLTRTSMIRSLSLRYSASKPCRGDKKVVDETAEEWVAIQTVSLQQLSMTGM